MTFLSTKQIPFLFLINFVQALALNACTTLVSVEPKLTVETRNRVMKVISFSFEPSLKRKE